MGNLNDVQEQLRADYQKVTGEEPLTASASLVRAAEKIPLSHRSGRPKELLAEIVAARATLQPEHDAARKELGTDGCVFLWLGPSRYLAPPLVLFFRDGFDERNADACLVAPWDTKGLLRHQALGRRLEPPEARAEVARYSLPPFEARQFLSDVLACCYSSAGSSAYVAGDRPLSCFPGRNCIPFTSTASYEETPAYTFEARIHKPLPFAQELDAIVLDPLALWGATMSKELLTLRRWCRANEVALTELDNQETMQQVVVRKTNELLMSRGGA
ncbi:MAG TPA: hypothetical protein DFS52_27535 [Myxococcales bacterium]|jgi:hypothetical protein|nr:hypothetical protein [Myxococcales bacterium]